MFTAVRPVRSLLLSIFILMAGGGFMPTLVSVRLEGAGAGAPLIGLVGSAYFLGLTLGSLLAAGVIRRVGHIRAFACFVSLLSASTLAYALYQSVGLWAALRLIDGFCLAGVYVCLESWLNDRAEPSQRGSVLAAYMVALYAGQGLGQFLLNLGQSWIASGRVGFVPFFVVLHGGTAALALLWLAKQHNNWALAPLLRRLRGARGWQIDAQLGQALLSGPRHPATPDVDVPGTLPVSTAAPPGARERVEVRPGRGSRLMGACRHDTPPTSPSAPSASAACPCPSRAAPTVSARSPRSTPRSTRASR